MRSFSDQMLAPSDGSYLCLTVGWTRRARLSGSTFQILDALLIQCISLHYFLAAQPFVIVTFVCHICRAASSSGLGSRSVDLSGLSPHCRSLLCHCPTVAASLRCCFTASDHQHCGAIALKPSFLLLVCYSAENRQKQKHPAFLKYSFMYFVVVVAANLVFLCFCIIFGDAIWVHFLFCLEGFSAKLVWAKPAFIVVSSAFVSSCYLSWTCSSCVCRLLNFTCLL